MKKALVGILLIGILLSGSITIFADDPVNTSQGSIGPVLTTDGWPGVSED